jgi:hypothetical protein
MTADTEPGEAASARWFSRGVAGIGASKFSFLADLGHEIPTALLPSLLTVTLHAPASALGLIEGISDAAAGVARLAGGALADDPGRRRRVAVGGYTTTAVLSAAIGAVTAPWQAGILRAGAWAARGLRVPARNALLADIVPPSVCGRAYGFERAMDNLGAIGGPLLAIGLVALVGVRAAIGLSVIPGLLAALAIIYAIRHTTAARQRASQPIRLRIRPVLRGQLGRLMIGVTAFEVGNAAATLMILRATNLFDPGRSQTAATQLALVLYVLYNVAATLISIRPGGTSIDSARSESWLPGRSASPPGTVSSLPARASPGCSRSGSSWTGWGSDAARRPSQPPLPPWPLPASAVPHSGCSLLRRQEPTSSPARSPVSCGPPCHPAQDSSSSLQP